LKTEIAQLIIRTGVYVTLSTTWN